MLMGSPCKRERGKLRRTPLCWRPHVAPHGAAHEPGPCGDGTRRLAPVVGHGVVAPSSTTAEGTDAHSRIGRPRWPSPPSLPWRVQGEAAGVQAGRAGAAPRHGPAVGALPAQGAAGGLLLGIAPPPHRHTLHSADAQQGLVLLVSALLLELQHAAEPVQQRRPPPLLLPRPCANRCWRHPRPRARGRLRLPAWPCWGSVSPLLAGGRGDCCWGVAERWERASKDVGL